MTQHMLRFSVTEEAPNEWLSSSMDGLKLAKSIENQLDPLVVFVASIISSEINDQFSS